MTRSSAQVLVGFRSSVFRVELERDPIWFGIERVIFQQILVTPASACSGYFLPIGKSVHRRPVLDLRFHDRSNLVAFYRSTGGRL
jgi:hypothetical protein